MIRAAVAQGYGAAAAKACDESNFPTCKRCRGPHSEQLRKTWGCDHAAERPVWSSSCPECGGVDPDCTRCEGVGEVDHHRCPASFVFEAPPHLRSRLDLLMRAHRHYDERNVLPAQGAWLDQTRSFLMCIDLIDAERGFWDQVLHDYQEKKRKEIERRNKANKR